MGEGPAAFFDILAPPYHTNTDHVSETEEIRECHFFCEVSFANNNLIHSEQNHKQNQFVWLRRIKSPDDYFCDTEPYAGPKIHADD